MIWWVWEYLPLAIYPDIEDRCFSGSQLLLNWEKIPGNPVTPLMEMDENGRPYRVIRSLYLEGRRGISRAIR